jgi:hypothetical protein
MDLEEWKIDLVAAIALEFDCAFFAAGPEDNIVSTFGKKMREGRPPSTGSDDGCAHICVNELLDLCE